MIARKTVFCLALAQLIAWGVSYYMIGVLGELIGADLGWGGDTIYGGFTVALLAMGATSPLAGRLIDRHGGRLVMSCGAVLSACALLILAVCETKTLYYIGWLLLGLAMRATLYDAAFASLARIGGAAARRPISLVTLLGGLASTTFWPLGHAIADTLGWRWALVVYAGFALLTVPLYRAIPPGQVRAARGRETNEGTNGESDTAKAALAPKAARRDIVILGALFALTASGASFLNAGMSSHMIGILTGLGLGGASAVWISSLRGVGQSVSRLCEIVFGGRLSAPSLCLVASAIVPLAFCAGFFAGRSQVAACAFAFFYGAGNGLLTIARGALPLTLFDARTYGSVVGRLIAPSFLLAAAAPLAYALVDRHFGDAGALYLSLAVSSIVFLAAAGLRMRRAASG